MAFHLLSDVDVVAVSLVDKGANRRKFYLRKQEDEEREEFLLPPSRIVKADDWSAVYCIVAEPGARENPGVGADTDLEDEWRDADEIRKAAHRFMKNGALVNKMHEALDPFGTVVENFVAQSTFLVGEELIKEGAWVIGIAPTDDGKAAIEKGEFTGVSIQGTGIRTLVEKAALTSKGRKSLPSSAFVFPKDKRYPIHDRAHAANALARSSGKPEEAAVRAAVCKKFPDMPACKRGVQKELEKVLGPPGTDIARNQAAARGPLRHLIAFYMKKPHPFTACVRDNTKRFGPDRAKRVCAVLKDLGEGTTKWRSGGKKMMKAEDVSDELVETWALALGSVGVTHDDIVFLAKALEDTEGRLGEGVTDTENKGWLRAIGKTLGISKEDVDAEVELATEEETTVSDNASDERLERIEEAITKSSAQVEALANRLADIAETLAGKKKEDEEKEEEQVPQAEVYHRLEEVAKSLDEIKADVDKLASGDSTQRDDQRDRVTKSESDHPLAGLLIEE
jgi:hypothetical protein